MGKDKDGESFIFRMVVFIKVAGKITKCMAMEAFIINQAKLHIKVIGCWTNSKALENYIMRNTPNMRNLITSII